MNPVAKSIRETRCVIKKPNDNAFVTILILAKKKRALTFALRSQRHVIA